MLRPGLPVNARLKIVRCGVVCASASAQAGCTFVSGQRKNAVPITAALAPRISAAATPRPSAIPPAATTGILTASTIAGTSAIKPTSCCSAFVASATVVAVANHEIRRDFNSETNDGGYNPKIDETAAGAIGSNAWHCSLK